MLSRRGLLLLSLFFLGATMHLPPTTRGQSRAKPFDQSMSLDETMVWLGQQLTLERSVVRPSTKTVWTHGTRLVKAKGCSLTYWSSIQTDGVEPGSLGSASSELWTLKLSGLDPARIRGLPMGQVWFWAVGDVHDAIRTSMFNRENRLQGIRGNRAMGHFWVRDERHAEEVADALSHAVELCRQGKP